MKKQNSIYTLLIALLCFVSSCDYLGVSDQLAGGLQNTEQVFDNVSYTKRWYANVFAGIPDYSGINSVNVGAFKNPWTGMSAVVANRQLLRTENKLSLSMGRLSSGYKINKAGDNPAGMAISSKMKAQIDGLN